MITEQEARDRTLAASGATLITFVGVCHETVGHVLFPCGPSFLGGPVGWHGLGLLAILGGVLLLGGTLRLFPFPVVLVSSVVVLLGAFFLVVAAAVHERFHGFALTGSPAGAFTGYRHHRAAGRRRS